MLTINGRTFDLVTLDFEVYYDSEYTLKSMPTSLFVQDARFQTHMVGVQFNDGPTEVWPAPLVRRVLSRFDWARTALLAYNTPFDGYICTQRYNIRPAYYLDALAMARAAFGVSLPNLELGTVGAALGLGDKHGRDSLHQAKGLRSLPPDLEQRMAAYCLRDVQLVHQVFWKLLDYVPDDELDLIDITTRMFCEPVLHVNRQLVQEELDAQRRHKQELLLRASLVTGATESTLQSNPQFAALLTTRFGLTPPSSLDQDTLAAIRAESSDPALHAVIDARLAVKSTIGESRAQTFLAASATGAQLPVLLQYCGAHTTRWSGGNGMNLQNLPRGGRLRRALQAPPKHRLVVADSAQIEARINAWLWGQHDLLEAFRTGRDIYSEFATILFGRPVDRKRAERGPDGKLFYPDFEAGFVGKTAILGLGYQMGATRFLETVKAGGAQLTFAQAQEAVALYRRQNARIVQGWALLRDLIPRMTLTTFHYEHGPVEFMHEAVRLPSGLFLRYPRLGPDGDRGFAFYKRQTQRTALYEGLLCENLVQALARCVIAEQMLRLHRDGVRLVTMTHDEIVALAPSAQAETTFQHMLQVMATPPAWAPDLPLKAEGGHAREYSK